MEGRKELRLYQYQENILIMSPKLNNPRSMEKNMSNLLKSRFRAAYTF